VLKRKVRKEEKQINSCFCVKSAEIVAIALSGAIELGVFFFGIEPRKCHSGKELIDALRSHDGNLAIKTLNWRGYIIGKHLLINRKPSGSLP
jgi:hypothetical protein